MVTRILTTLVCVCMCVHECLCGWVDVCVRIGGEVYIGYAWMTQGTLNTHITVLLGQIYIYIHTYIHIYIYKETRATSLRLALALWYCV